GRLVSGGSGDATKLKLWAKEGQGEPDKLLQSYSAFSLAVLADGRLAAGDDGGRIKIWPDEDSRGKGEPAQVLLHGGHQISLALLPDGRLASGGQDGKIKLWPKQGQSEPEEVLLHGIKSSVWSLEVLPDGRLASGDGRTIKLWPKDGQGEPEIRG